MNPAVFAGIIAAVVSLIGSLLTFWAAHWQVRSKIEELTQAQFKDVQAKRIEVYPLLWTVLQTFTSDWRLAGRAADEMWISKFVENLNAWHAQYGVFLSDNAYRKFFQLRDRALKAAQNCNAGHDLTEDLLALDLIYSGNADETDEFNRNGLATWLKNDLGSFKIPALAIQVGKG
ncbi:MAG TPA: hypothetical protein VJA94_21635 [Candidatus Angelobacter sp.]